MKNVKRDGTSFENIYFGDDLEKDPLAGWQEFTHGK